ncbi:hypothetical protein HXX76_012376 [Chlamydomonas incerta]|uniref:PGG domain-containing protein n=1 Tax=Chlamydomonas incerta TaxID=51695 RepID=A0A835SVA9_CHLIN|nr:hypothetical protein HXX76_012376 [Chlamydomonas incerta]|eukprot:KAG2427440.1 hypothetical protein HXX76_012376 [Chlamydomonas incerta]
MVNFGIHRGQAVSPGDSAHRTGECSLASGSLEHLERAGWGPDVDPLLAAHAELPPRAQLARGYGSKGRIWARVAYGAGVAPAKERLNNLWNTTSLVSALLMTFTYGNIASPARPDGPPPEPGSAAAVALDFANVAGILSFIMSLFCLMFNVVFHEVDYCTSPRDERDFILSFAGVFDAVAGLFAGSVVMLLLSVLCTIYVMHPMRTFWITVGTCIALAVALGATTIPITVFTRYRLWVRLEGALEHKAGGGGSGDGGGSTGAKVAAAAAVSEGRLDGQAEERDGEKRTAEGRQRAAGAAARSGRMQAFPAAGDVAGGGGGGLRGESHLVSEQ